VVPLPSHAQILRAVPYPPGGAGKGGNQGRKRRGLPWSCRRPNEVASPRLRRGRKFSGGFSAGSRLMKIVPRALGGRRVLLHRLLLLLLLLSRQEIKSERNGRERV